MERRNNTAPVRCVTDTSGDQEMRRIEGLGAVYYDGTTGTEFKLFDDVYERIMPGAFDRAIKEDDVRGLFNHDSNMVLGRTSAGTMTLESTREGLVYSIEPSNTTVSKDVAEHIQRGDVSGSSFAFTVVEETWLTENRGEDDEREVREIQDVCLYDVGPVVFPAYTATTSTVTEEARASYEAYLQLRDGEDFVDIVEVPEIDLETYKARVRVAELDD